MKPSSIRPAAAFLLALTAMVSLPSAWAAGSPGQAIVNGQKALVLISRDPPGARCNNNIQVAAELSNLYKIPVQIIPVTFAGPGAKAPAVYYGGQQLAVDGGELNGMVSYDQIADILEIEGAPKQAQQGRLMEVKKDFDTLKSAIKSGN